MPPLVSAQFTPGGAHKGPIRPPNRREVGPVGPPWDRQIGPPLVPVEFYNEIVDREARNVAPERHDAGPARQGGQDGGGGLALLLEGVEGGQVYELGQVGPPEDPEVPSVGDVGREG